MGETAKIPTRTFQDVEEIIKGDKQGNPVAVPLRPLDQRVADLALLKFLEQKNSFRGLSRKSPQPGAMPRIMEFQRLLNIDPKILKSGLGNLENIDQGTSLRQRVLHDVKPLRLLESGLRRDPNIADQKSLHTVQEQLLSTAGGLGNYRQVPFELEASPDSDALAEVASPLAFQENGDAERLTSKGNGLGRVGSLLQDPSANAGGSRTTLQDVFNSLNKIEQFGSLQNGPLAVNPYARGSLLPPDQKPEGPGKPAQILGHGARDQKNPKGGGGGGRRSRRRKRRRRERRRRKRKEKK